MNFFVRRCAFHAGLVFSCIVSCHTLEARTVPVARPQDLLQRQLPPYFNRAVYDRLGPENASIVVSLGIGLDKLELNEEALRECATSAGLPARPMIAAPSAILKAIRLYYGAFTSASVPAASDSRAPPPETPVVARLFSQNLFDRFNANKSDQLFPLDRALQKEYRELIDDAIFHGGSVGIEEDGQHTKRLKLTHGG